MLLRSFAFYLLIAGAAAAGEPPGKPLNLRVDDLPDPVGTGAQPAFGWFVTDPDPNEIQTGYHILVASTAAKIAAGEGDVWDSGMVDSRRQNHVAYAGAPLESDRRYHWAVRTRDRDGKAGPYSEPAAFTVGLLENSDWSGAFWIRRDTGGPDDHTCYRRKIELPGKPVARATAYITSAHKYDLYFNGRLVGKGPAYHYPRYHYYNAHDITSLIRPGEPNQFAVLNRWFGGGQGRPAGARGLIVKAIVHYEDGTRTEIGTGADWRQTAAEAWTGGQPQRNRGEGVGYVEHIDARKLTPGWMLESFDDSSWPAATVIGAHPVEPWTGKLAPDLTRIDETTITPASITRLENGKYMVDLGLVYAGVPKIEFSGGEPGTVVRMLGGYILGPSGEIDTAGNQVTDMSFRAVLNGETFLYQPAEYLGMRYFQIDNPPMPVTAENFSFVVRHSRLDRGASSFDSSNDTLNAVWDFMKHSLLTCLQEQFVDTPTREKGGFLGDSAIQSIVAMSTLNERVLTRRALVEYLQSMDHYWSSPENRGRINAVYPNNDGGRDIPDYTQAYLPWVWYYYMETGDRAFLEEHYGKFKDIAGYVHRHTDADTGLVTRLTGGSGPYQYGIVDWPASMRFGYDMDTAARTVINGWAYADYDVMARIAGELGHAADVKLYRSWADDLKGAINKRLVNGSGVYVDGLSAAGSRSSHASQHANMFPLALGIVPGENEPAVTARVKELGMSVGMVTLPWLIRAIGEAEEGPHLIDLFTNKNQYGWARCLARGATSTWETWDADTASGGISMSHAWGAAGLEGYVRYILGIRPASPQFETVEIRPLDFGAALERAQGTVPTDRGGITVSWERKEDAYRMHVELPVNVTADILVPKGGASAFRIHVDGEAVEGVEEGAYIRLKGFGSGRHSIARTAE